MPVVRATDPREAAGDEHRVVDRDTPLTEVPSAASVQRRGGREGITEVTQKRVGSADGCARSSR